MSKVIAKVLIENGEDLIHRHVTVKVDLPIGGPIIESMDLEMDDSDIVSIKKIIHQFNESKFGDKLEIKIKVKA